MNKEYIELADEFAELMYTTNPRDRLMVALHWLDDRTNEEATIIGDEWEDQDAKLSGSE